MKKPTYDSFGSRTESYDEEKSSMEIKFESDVDDQSVWRKVALFSVAAVIVGLCTITFPLSTGVVESDKLNLVAKQRDSNGQGPATTTTTTIDYTTTVAEDVVNILSSAPAYTSPSSGHLMASSSNSVKPNFIFVLADDLGYSSIGYDELDLEFASPFMTSLAKDGILMTNYYAQEICTPSRASLMTGRYPITIGMQYEELQTDVNWGLNLTEVLLPEVLRDNGGYKNYALGKWNLGHFTPKLLPTARGFDEYLGYLAGQNYYWSKHMPNQDDYQDFTVSNAQCFNAYNGSDLEDYSTFLYRDKAIKAIHHHDFKANPMFMYLAFQAVHDPFDDINKYEDGLPSSYLGEELYAQFIEAIPGRNRQQYAMALRLLDQAVESIVNALITVNQMDNTYIIFASDNGGCYQAGGRNGALRGTKGSLWEGGVKVDSFIYSPLLESRVRGSTYSGIMHVSDWFPTILELANIKYIPTVGHELDGFSQVSAMTGMTLSNPRTYLLYNMYVNVQKNLFTSGNNAMAIRNNRYKLIHAFINNPSSKWYSFEVPNSDDWDMTSGSCPQFLALIGGYQTFLFDLATDPNETKNLYNIAAYSNIKATLYAELDRLTVSAKLDTAPTNVSIVAETSWVTFGSVIGPWTGNAEDISFTSVGKSFPQRCDTTTSTFEATV